MKRILFTIMLVSTVLLSASAFDFSKAVMVGGPSAANMQNNNGVDDDEHAAYQWFIGHSGASYVSAQEVIDGTVNLNRYAAVWVNLDRELGRSNAEDFVNALKSSGDPMGKTDFIAKLTAYYKGGGNLLLTNHASVLLKEMGRYHLYPLSLGSFNSGSGANNVDVWYARTSYLNLDAVNDKSGDRLFEGIAMETIDGYKRFPLVSAGWKEDHNCFFNLDVTGNDNLSTEKYAKLASEFGVEYLAVWPHIGDICSAAITRWNPFGNFQGKAIAIGFGGYEWNMNNGTNTYRGNIERLTLNALAELVGDSSSEPNPDPDPETPDYNFAGAAMLYSSASDDDDETAAREWFVLNGGTAISAENLRDGKASLKGYKALWVNLDRELGKSSPEAFVNTLTGDPMVSTAVVNAVTAFYKGGGKLLLTNHAAIMLNKTGRYFKLPLSLGRFGSGSAVNSPTVQRARVSYMNLNAINDKSGDRLFAGIEILTDGYKYFNLIGAGMQEGHNSFFTLDVPYNGGNFPNDDVSKYAMLKSTFGVEQLAVAPDINDICSAAITRWLPMDDYDGVAIAIGFGGYEWKQNGSANPYQDNIKHLTANALNELLADVSYDHIYSPQPPEDGVLVHYDMDLDGGYVTETVSNTPCMVQGRFGEAMPGAVKGGTALRLDAFSNFIEGPAMPDLNLTQMTVDLWCAAETYPMGTIDTSAEGWGAIAGNERDGRGWLWEVSSRGTYRFIVSINGSPVTVNIADRLPKYQWCHLVAAVDAVNGTVKVYNNSYLVGEATCPKGTITNGNASMMIGRSRNSAIHADCFVNAFNGLIDDIVVVSGIADVNIRNTAAPANEADLTVSASRYEGNILRPQFHAAAGANWGNETHGLFYDSNTKLFHAFYQKNANGHYLSHMHWGHLVSTDLLTWTEVRTAIAPSEDYDWKGCWSGCVFRDPSYNNGEPAIFYTGVNDADPYIIEAHATDESLLDWYKIPTGISRPASGYDFRDPYVFAYNGNFYMVIGCSVDGRGGLRLHTYDRTTNKWSPSASVFFSGTGAGSIPQGGFWEMPVVVKIDGRWVVAVTTCAVNDNDVRAIYWVGNLEGSGSGLHFVPDRAEPQTIEIAGLSGYGYGLLSPSVMQHDGKTIAIGIVPDKVGSYFNYNNGWSHVYSLPRQWNVVDGSLVQTPYDGIAALRTSEGKVEHTAETLKSDIIDLPSGRMMEFDLEVEAGSTGTYGLRLFKGTNSQAELSYNMATGELSLNTYDLNRVYFDSHHFQNGFSTIVPKPSRAVSRAEGTAHIHAIVDHSTVDLFVNDKLATTMRIYPQSTTDTDAEFFKHDDNNNVVRLAVHPLTTEGSSTTTSLDSAMFAPANAASVRVANGTIVVTGVEAPSEVSVYSVSGALMLRRTIVSDAKLDAPLAHGMYIVKVRSGHTATTHKIVL